MKDVPYIIRRQNIMIPVISKLPKKVIVAMVVLIIAIGFVAVAAGVFKPSEDKEENIAMEMEMTTGSMTVSGTAQEGVESTEPLDFGGAMVHQIKITFTWKDDNPDSNPDSFEIKLRGKEMEETANGAASPLEIFIDLDTGESSGSEGGDCCGFELDSDFYSAEEEEESSDWNLHITLTDGGDQEFGPLGIISVDDTSNPYEVEIEFTYCACCPPSES
jgi:hypothetical protein